MDRIVENVSNVGVSSNEYITKFSANRNLEKLARNDIKLAAAYDALHAGPKEWNPETQYEEGEKVWRLVFDEDGTPKAYVFKSLSSGNSGHDPVSSPRFWADQNRIDPAPSDGGSALSRDIFSGYFALRHENTSAHRFGRLTMYPEDNDRKIMLTDMSNLAVDRSRYFFPYETRRLKTGPNVLYGYYRKWHDGTLEYDMAFRLGEVEDGAYQVNVFEPDLDDPVEARHFMPSENVFAPNESGTAPAAEFNGIRYVGRLAGDVDVYSARIEFDVPFVDSSYVIIPSASLQSCVAVNVNTINSADYLSPGKNQLVFANKLPGSFTPCYVLDTRANRYSALAQNVFRCRIVGRWKVAQGAGQ